MFVEPCVPAHDSDVSINGFISGFRDAGNGTAITNLPVTITDNNTIWFYDANTCGQGGVGGGLPGGGGGEPDVQHGAVGGARGQAEAGDEAGGVLRGVGHGPSLASPDDGARALRGASHHPVVPPRPGQVGS